MNNADSHEERIKVTREVLVRLDATMAHVDEIGPNGPQIIGLNGNWLLAIDVLTQTKDADAIGVFVNEETGHRIDFHWGFTSENPREKGQGLSKLLRWHPDIVGRLDQIIRLSVVVDHPKHDRYILSDGRHLIVISERHNGMSKQWLVTAFNAGPKPSKRDRVLLNLGKLKISQAISRTVDGANVTGQTNVPITGTNSTDRLVARNIADVREKINDK
jgi:hypothetical protein